VRGRATVNSCTRMSGSPVSFYKSIEAGHQSVHISYFCTYDLYGPMRNVFDVCRSMTRESGNQEFFGPYEWH
jgi:hypothetical protein